MRSLPTLLTILRIAAAPVVAGLVLWAHASTFTEGPAFSATLYGFAAALFVLAALTDALDGWLARKLGVVTPFGAALDHSADKVLVAATLVVLSYALFPLPMVIAAAILVVREFAVAGLREALSASGRALPVSSIGKLKAFAEMVALALWLVIPALPEASAQLLDLLYAAAQGLVWFAVALALWSGASYVRAAIDQRT
ncbi:MAG: CDP-diacylglycerol--glycerol-3-phosphate 3-phosphatidyltransferase [Hyphomonadaceae bacterium]|nr:CDP-diacylglycerol--glycerol-3-phosphate 3-phosphatidyltransferase [Hyphomonadaceae bacterium]